MRGTPILDGRRLANIALGVVQVLRRYWVLVLPAGPGHYASHCVHQASISKDDGDDDLAMLANHYVCHVSSGCKASTWGRYMSAEPYTVSVSPHMREQETGDQGCESDHHPSPLSLSFSP